MGDSHPSLILFSNQSNSKRAVRCSETKPVEINTSKVSNKTCSKIRAMKILVCKRVEISF
jgi:hypothetical protein